MAIDDQRGNLNAAPPLLELGLGFGAEAPIGIFFFRRFGGPSGVNLGKLVLLGGDLDHQALAQIPRSHACRIKVLHHLNSAFHQIKSGFLVELPPLGELREGLSQFLIAYGEISILVQVPDDEFCCLAQPGFELQRAKLPLQVIGESGRLGKEILEGGLVTLFKFGLGAEAGIEVFLEVGTEINFVKGVLGRGLRLRRYGFMQVEPFFPLLPLDTPCHLVEHRN